MNASASIGTERGSSDLRAAILMAAAPLFAENGYAATSMREVASAADCTKPALYYYFDSKAALFVAVIKSRTDAINEILATTFSGAGTVRERLQRAAEAYFDYVRRDPVALKVLWRSEKHLEAGQPGFDWKTTRATYLDRTRRLLQEGVDSGEIGAHVHLDTALYALIGIVDIRCTLWVLQGEPIPEDCASRALELLFGGMSP